jgi:hypothetical protein
MEKSLSQTKPQSQCPNCNQFELGFTLYRAVQTYNHAGENVAKEKVNNSPDLLVRCGAFDCGYTGKPEEFEPQ